MAKFLGNIADKYDFWKIVQDVKTSDGYSEWDYLFKDIDKKISNMHLYPDADWAMPLHSAGYQEPMWNGIGYSPGIQFDGEVIKVLDKMFGTICTQCWINKLPIDRLAAAHKDRDGREEVLLKLGTLVRYHVHLGDPDPGHVFWVENKCHYMEKHGNCYKWENYLSLHGGSNTGYTDKLIMIYRGLIPHEPFEFDYVWSEGTGVGAWDDVRLKLADGRIV
jgi:hypothetical protein